MHLLVHLERAARRFPERIAFIAGPTRLRYREALDQVERMAKGLLRFGVTPGASVAVYSENSIEAFLAVLAVLRAGGRWVPLNLRNTVAENARLLETADARVLIYSESCASAAHEIARLEPLDLRSVCLAQGVAEVSLPTLEHAASDLALPPLDGRPELELVVFPTGGTTGPSKAAVWTNRVMLTLAITSAASLPHADPVVHLCAAPMTHAAGVMVLAMMQRAPTTVILEKPDPGAILAAIATHRVTHFYVPPTVLYRILAHPTLEDADTDSLRCLMISAAPVAPEKLREAIARLGPVVGQAYGQAECPMLITFLSPHELIDDSGELRDDLLASCGSPTPLTEVAVVSEDGAVLPPGQLGEIVVRGDLVMAGYYRNVEATAEATLSGWHRTGDVGRMDEAGYVYIIDRKRDMIITGGFNVYSADVERAILAHEAVQDCAVVGVPDPTWGEAIKAVVELKPGCEATADEIIAVCKRALGGVKTPKTVEFWPELPRSAVGKILRRSVRERYWAGQARAVS
jgi:acyl-CoA synthetase (AMP-forming)/AMP-acid ligase II